MFVICLCEPVRDIKSPPKDAYAVLTEVEPSQALWRGGCRTNGTYTTSAEPPSNLYTCKDRKS